MRIGISCVVALACSSLAPFEARAQLERCGNDTLSPQEAEARVEWARRCALNKVGSASQGFDVGLPGTPMIDYQEVDGSGYPTTQNAYQSDIMNFEVNATYSYSLYMRSPTAQEMDPYGYYKWVSTSKRQFPYFPSFGIQSYVASSSNTQLFPHPNLSDCNLYTDRSGYNQASSFFVNLYCTATNTRLTNGVPLAWQSGAEGSDKRYTVVVPEGSSGLHISTSGGWGNANLYVRREAAANPTAYDCASTYSGNYESCYFSSPAPGTYHVLVRGATSYGDVSVSATWNQLQRGSPIYNLYAGWGVEKYYSFNVPSSNITNLNFWLSGGTGDADIYVRYGAPPTLSQYDCRPYIGGNSETCSFSYPAGGTWYVMVRAWSTYSGVSLGADYTEYIEPDPCYPYLQQEQEVNLQPICQDPSVYCPPPPACY